MRSTGAKTSAGRPEPREQHAAHHLATRGNGGGELTLAAPRAPRKVATARNDNDLPASRMRAISPG